MALLERRGGSLGVSGFNLRGHCRKSTCGMGSVARELSTASQRCLRLPIAVVSVQRHIVRQENTFCTQTWSDYCLNLRGQARLRATTSPLYMPRCGPAGTPKEPPRRSKNANYFHPHPKTLSQPSWTSPAAKTMRRRARLQGIWPRSIAKRPSPHLPHSTP